MSPNSPAPDRKPSADVGTDLKQLGKYRIERRLGVGGMGTVYLAVDTDLNRTVALKVLAKERAQNPTLVRRFKSEGQAAALMKHENIVSVFESGQIDGYLYLALEFIEGADVLDLIRRYQTIPVKRSIEIVRQTAAALQHAHEKGIVHRDIKPSNLMVARDGTVKLTDMGLARSIDDDNVDTSITRDGTTVGTVDYMAPEQAADSRAADIRSDLYSLGCSWYHMLTGRPPFPDGGITAKLSAHATYPVPNPRDFNKDVPEAVVAVIQRLMAKKPEQRHQTPAELIRDLAGEALLRGGGQLDLLAIFSEDEVDDADGAYDDEGTADPDTATRELSAPPPPPQESTPRQPRPQAPPSPPSRRLPQRESQFANEALDEEEEESVDPSGRSASRKPEKRREVLRRLEFDVPPRTSPPEESSPPRAQGGVEKPQQGKDAPGRKTGSPAAEAPSPAPRSTAGKRGSASRNTKSASQPRGGAEPIEPETESAATPDEPEVTMEDLKNRSRRRKAEQGLPIDDEDTGLPTETDRSEDPAAKPKRSPAAPAKGPAAAGRDAPRRGSAKPKPTGTVDVTRSSDSGGTRKSLFGGVSINMPRIEPGRFAMALVVLCGLIAGAWALSRLGRDDALAPTVPAEPRAAGENGGRRPDDLPVPDPAAPTDPEEAVGAKSATGEPTREYPGLEDILPDWLKSGWARPPRRDLPVISVRRGGGSATAVAPNLVEALARAGGAESKIIIDEPEGRELTGKNVASLRRLVLSGPESRPGVVFVHERSLIDGAWLSFSNGTLEVENLQFVINLDPTIQGSRSLFALKDANLLLRNCSFVVQGGAAVALASIAGRSQDGNRILCENCLAAGNKATLLDLREAHADVLLSNCLLVGDSGAFVAGETGKAPVATTLRIVHSTAVCADRVVQLAGASDSKLRIEVRQSLFANSGGTQAACLRLTGWETQSVSGGTPPSLAVGTEHVRFAGWPTLATVSHRQGTIHIEEIDAWNRFWNASLPSDDVVSGIAGLEGLELVTAPGIERARQLLEPTARAGLGVRSLLGVKPDQLTEPPAVTRERAHALAGWDAFREALVAGVEAQKVVRFDLTKGATLPAFLAGSECPDGTHVVCFGVGSRSLPAIHLKNRRLKLSFEQGEGAPLTLTPESAPSSAAFLLIEGGHVEIEGLNCVLPGRGTRESPGTCLRAIQGGRFRLSRSEIVGPTDARPDSALVEIEASSGQGMPSVIVDCFLKTPGTAVRCDLTGQSLLVENSVVASGGTGIVIADTASTDERLALRRTTFACNDAAVRSLSQEASPAAETLVSECVFGPLDEAVRSAAVLAIATTSSPSTGMSWWEEASGHSGLLTGPLKKGDAPGGSGFVDGWVRVLGPGRIQFSIHGVQAVLFALPRQSLRELKADSLRLDPSCQAAGWGDDGGAIGADMTKVGSPRRTVDKPTKTEPGKPPTGRATF